MDTQTQLKAERDWLEAALLAIEQEQLRSVPGKVDESDLCSRIGNLLFALGLVNAELAEIRLREAMSRRA